MNIYILLFLVLLFPSSEKNIFIEEAEGKPMREVGKISVTFTPRVFPTPVRESQTAQEDEVHFYISSLNLHIFTHLHLHILHFLICIFLHFLICIFLHFFICILFFHISSFAHFFNSSFAYFLTSSFVYFTLLICICLHFYPGSMLYGQTLICKHAENGKITCHKTHCNRLINFL